MKFDIRDGALLALGLTREEFEDAYEQCPSCEGMCGYDASRDCEVYDDWQECPNCEGKGYIEIV